MVTYSNFGSRLVGTVDLVISLFLLGVLLWSILTLYDTFRYCLHCLAVIVLIGLYVLASLIISTLLIGSTFSAVKNNDSRKWIAITSCGLSTFGLIGGTIFSCVAPGVFHKSLEGFFVMMGVLLKCATLICVVCKYVWLFSEMATQGASKPKYGTQIVPLKRDKVSQNETMTITKLKRKSWI